MNIKIRKYPIKKCEKCGCEFKFIKFKNKPQNIYCKKCKNNIENKIRYWENPKKYREKSKINKIKFADYYKKYNEKIKKEKRWLKPEERLKRKLYRQSEKGREVEKKSKLKYRYKNGGKEKDKLWRAKNKDKVKKYRSKYKKSAIGLFKACEYQHKRREWGKTGRGLTLDEWQDIIKKYNFRCAICKKKTKLEQDHIIPLSKHGKHDKDNIQPLCRRCNALKGNKLNFIMSNFF